MEKRTKSPAGRVVYIVDGARTPFLKMRTGPGPFSASDLAVSAGKSLVHRYVDPTRFDEIIIGCAAPSEEEANIARVIALRLGCSTSAPAWTVQRNCASGLQAIDSAVQSISQGRSELVLAGGTEAMSRAPLILNLKMARWMAGMQGAKQFTKKLALMTQVRPSFFVPIIALIKGLTDPIVNLTMGQTAQELSFRFGITREEMDAFAVQSHQRALDAQQQERLNEITPLFSTKGELTDSDDGVRPDSSVERLAKLRPVFEKHGDITAGNSSQISDGAALVILASEDAVKKYDLPVLAKIVDVQWSALDPSIMGLGPVHAMTPIMKRQSLTLSDIDHIEINEAFAAQVIACERAWKSTEYCNTHLELSEPMGEIDSAKLNPEGGAIAQGHPVGASGARLVLHVAKMLNQKKQQRGLASLCIGGGQGGAILLERCDGVEA